MHWCCWLHVFNHLRLLQVFHHLRLHKLHGLHVLKHLWLLQLLNILHRLLLIDSRLHRTGSRLESLCVL